MKLRLPRKLVAAIVAAASAVSFVTLASGSAAYASTTYDNLTEQDYFEANNHVYNTGKGTFYLETESCALNLTLTLNLNDFAAYQSVHDYANAGYYSPFVTWTYNNNPGATYGMADVSSGYSSADYSGVTGMWGGSPWTTNNKITVETLGSYADASGNVTLTINNTPEGTTNNVVVTALNSEGVATTLYSANGLRSSGYVSQHITSFTVNMNYVHSVTLNTESILDSSSFTPPKDYTSDFVSARTDGTSVGRIVFLGDSITHGVQDMSWRWGLFKTMVDNGIEFEIAGPLSGYHSDPLNGDYNGNFTSSQYGGETFDNAHYAQSSGRTHNMLTASNSGNSLGGSTGVNYGGVTSAKVGKEYNGDTYVMMMGTNDILSDGANTVEKMATVTNRLLGEGSLANGTWTNAGVEGPLVGLSNENEAYRGEWGTMGKIIDNMKMGADDVMYVMPVPTWGVGRTGLHVYADLVPAYNEKLEAWTKAYSSTHTGTVKFVDINRGLVDKTLNGTYLAPDAFFRTTGGDYIHPNEQGALIIAGNLAQGMGLAGRTAGLKRADSHTADTTWVNAAAQYIVAAGQSVTIGEGALDLNGGYTVDFSATFGNGATDGWLAKNNALSISVGDGSSVGTLKLSEGYISWGDKLLFCQDNSAQGNDNIRITYHTGDAANQVGNGYYVWLGDMLIGQALSGSTGTLSGITLSSVGATGTVSGLTYSNSAYAPTTKGITSADNAFYATITKVMASHDSTPTGSGITWTGATDKSVAKDAVVKDAAAFTDGKATINVTGTGTNFFGATSVTAKGNVEALVSGQTASTAFAALDGTLTGDVTMEFSASTVNNGAFSGTSGALIGSFNGASITGTFAAYIDHTDIKGDIVGGALTGSGSIGAVKLVLNSGEVTGTVYGGSKSAGTVGTGSGNAVSIAVNGGKITQDVIAGGTAGTVNGNAEITITGGVIGGNVTDGTTFDAEGNKVKDKAITGTSTITVEGNKASIGGSITADTVKLQNVAGSEYSDGFDKYAGTITSSELVLDNYTAGVVNAKLVTDYVTVSNGTNTTIRGLKLRNCSIDAEAGTHLTLGGTVESGNTISYTGTLYLEDGIKFDFSKADSITAGAEGLSSGQYVYKVKSDSEGHLLAADGSALTSAHTSTFTGAGVLAGKSFLYESATGALIAYGSDATYKIATSTVNYSDIEGVSGVTMSGGQLNLDKALKAGVTVTATGGTVGVGEGVNFSASSLSGSATIANNGGTVTLDVATSDSAPQRLTSITGDSGTVVVDAKLSVTGTQSAFKGTLIVNDADKSAYENSAFNSWGGHNQSNKTGYDLVLEDSSQKAGISSFEKVVLNNAGLYYSGTGTTINNLTLTENSVSSIKVEHMSEGTLLFDGETTLASGSELSTVTHWTSRVTFNHIMGNGTLNLQGSSAASSDSATYTINSLQGFSGALQFHKAGKNAMTSNISTGTGEDVTITGISLSEVSDGKGNIVNITGEQSLTVNGAVTVDSGSTLNLGNSNTTLNGALSGTVNVLADATLTLGDNFSATSATIAGAGYVDVHSKVSDGLSLSLHDGQDGYLSGTVDLSAYKNKVTFNNEHWKVNGLVNGGISFNEDTYMLSVAGGNVFYVNTTVTKDEVTAPTGGGKAVLVGNGTYVLGSQMAQNDKPWPGNAMISSDPTLWTGTVRLENVSGLSTSYDLNDYGNSASWVELKGISGYDRNWALSQGAPLSVNIILTNNGSNAAWTFGPCTDTGSYMTIDGRVKGDGTLNLTGSAKQWVHFRNDVAGWTGAVTSAQGTKTIKFSGDATEVNAQIVKTGGTMNVIAETDVTFNNTVTIDTLTATGHTVTLGANGEGDSATHGNLTLGAVSDIAKLVINDGATATATTHNQGTGFIKGTVNVNAGGTLNLSQGDTLGWGNNSTTAINLEGSEGKLATMITAGKQTFSTALTLNGNTLVKNGDGNLANKGLEIFQNENRIGTITANGTNNTISSNIYLRSKGTITTTEGAELTISGVVSNGAAEGAAEMVKEGAGTLTLSAANTFNQNLTVNAGTIVMGNNQALGAANGSSARLITINKGGTIDINGQSVNNVAYAYTLAGGSLVNNGNNTLTSKVQNVKLNVTADSVIGGTGNFYLISSGFGATSLTLNDNTLTKTGSNTVGLYSTTVSGGGTLRVEDGALNFTRQYDSNPVCSVDADIVVAKGSGSAVDGAFILANGHSLSSTEMGGAMRAAIQLGGSATLSLDGVNNLTLNGVLSNAEGATGSILKTGVGTAILNAANTYTGTTTIDAGALIASNSNALSHSVVTFSDLSEAESPYRILAFAQNLSFDGATGALRGGTQIDGTIKGLDGHLGYVVANTLTIDVDGDETHGFMHRYDEEDQTADRVEMKVDRLVKTGTGTQIIGGDYSEARGFTTNGLVISHGVEVQQGTLHMMTRGIVTTDFNVLAGATLKTSDERANSTTAAGAVQYNGKVTLHGTSAADAGTLFYEDGSTYTANGLYVDGFGKVVNQYDKMQFINGLYNAEGTTSNDIAFSRPQSDWYWVDELPSFTVLTAAGNFTGTVHLSSTSASVLREAYGLQVLGTGAKNALAGAVVDFTGDNVSVLSFRDSDTASFDWSNSKMDGTVAGLTGTNGSVYANTLTINTAAGAEYTYGGALHISGITKQGAGTQILQGTNLALGDVMLEGGTLNFSSGTASAESVHATAASLLSVGSAGGVGSATLSVKRLELGDTGTNNAASDLTIHQNGTLLVTGNVNNTGNVWGTGYKDDSLLFGEWNASGTVKVSGQLIADAADLLIGDTDNNSRTPKVSLLINGGTVAVHGVDTAYPGKNNNFEMNITDGGKLVLGSDGFFNRASTGNTQVAATVTKGAIGISADEVHINRGMAIGDVTFDTQKYTVSTADGGSVTHTNATGTIEVTGTITKAEGAADHKVTVTGGGELYWNTTSTDAIEKLEVSSDTLLKLKGGASLNLNELVLGSASAAELAMATATAPVVASDSDLKVNINVTGTQDEHGVIEVGAGMQTENVNLTVNTAANHVDYTAVPGNVLNLNGGSLTLNTISDNRILLSDSMLSPLANNMMIEVMSGIGALTINGTTWESGSLSSDMVVVGSAASVFGAQNGYNFSSNDQVLFSSSGSLYVTPEPATATLSLLALAALAARRKRK